MKVETAVVVVVVAAVLNIKGSFVKCQGGPIISRTFGIITDLLPDHTPLREDVVQNVMRCSSVCSFENCDAFVVNEVAEGFICRLYRGVSALLQVPQDIALLPSGPLSDMVTAQGITTLGGLVLYFRTDVDHSSFIVTTTTLPPTTTEFIITKTLVDNTNSGQEECPAGKGGIGVYIFEKDKQLEDNLKMFYIICRSFPGLTIGSSFETVGILPTSVQCSNGKVMVSVYAGSSPGGGSGTWQEPPQLTGICKDVIGYTVDNTDCVTLSLTQTGNRWSNNEFGTGDEELWNRYMECPELYLGVKLVMRASTMDSSKNVFSSAVCCKLVKA